MTHLLAKARHVSGARDGFIEAARLFWASYRADAGDPFDGLPYERRAVRHTAACLLARAVGKSPLEYLDGPARSGLADAAMALIASLPPSMEELIDRWRPGIDEGEPG
jgi:5-methylthioribose kinase